MALRYSFVFLFVSSRL